MEPVNEPFGNTEKLTGVEIDIERGRLIIGEREWHIIPDKLDITPEEFFDDFGAPNWFQSIQQERDKLIGILRSTSSDIESAVDLLREDYFENWDESVEILSVARRVIRSNLERIGVGEERT